MLRIKDSKRFENPESRLNYLISQLKDRLNSEELNRIYNRLLLERAVLRKKVENAKSKNVLISFCQKLARKKSEKLICDYFKN